MGLLKTLFPSKNQRVVNKYKSRINSINQLEVELQSSSEDILRKKTTDWKAQLSSITDNDQLASELEKILPEAFAVVKNACRRLCGTEVNVRGNNIGADGAAALGVAGRACLPRCRCRCHRAVVSVCLLR